MAFKEKINTYKRLEELMRRDKSLLFLYFTHPSCSICKQIMPNILEMAEAYPELEAYHVDMTDDPMIGGQLSLFMVPALLVYKEGRELLREAKYLVVDVIDPKLERIVDNFR